MFSQKSPEPTSVYVYLHRTLPHGHVLQQGKLENPEYFTFLATVVEDSMRERREK